MKSNKKFIALSAIVIGAAILITSAFADVIIGSGYYSLKSAVKNTAAKLTGEVDNFTFEATATIKIDDMVYSEDKNIEKFDILNEQRESSLISYYNGETRESYSYRNNEQSISKDLKTGTYHVYSYNTRPINMRGEQFFLDNPFEDERVQDAERIMDAFVGSLQDIVQVEEVNNKKMYIGNLSDTQVPPIINAISSYFVKYSIFNSYSYRADESKIPIPKTDIYVLGASGKAIENENGILENIIGSIRVSGTDEDGNEHVYSVEISVEIKDINGTIVTKPDLEGKKVTYNSSGLMLDDRYIGKYKNDIVIEEDNSFKKIGERYFEIHSVEEDGVSGRYYEVYYDGYEPEKVRAFDVTPYKPDKAKRNFDITFSYIDEDGEQKTGILHRSNLQNIYINFNVILMESGGYSSRDFEEGFDNNFIRVFE